METVKRIYGIDLGTTYSCIAFVNDDGKPEVIKNKEGYNTTPSVVFFEDENRVVGLEAKHMSVSAPSQVVEGIKYRMGDPNYIFEYQGKDYRAEEISSYILRKMVDDTSQATGAEIQDVVITCPAYFGFNEREATAQAGKIAGLNVHAILNEPTAAALTYSQKLDENETVLVFDLGGGTFDITMIEIQPEEIKVVVTGGNHHLGGRLWDEAIMKYLAHQFMEVTGVTDDPMDDDETRQDLYNKAEDAKKTLSALKQTTVMVTHAGRREKIVLTREKFEELTSALLENSITLTHQLLDEAKKKGRTRYDKILLVGGSCKMPQVPARLQQEFNIEPIIFDPDESVAKGAALYGQKLMINEMIKVRVPGWEGGEVDSAEVKKAREEVAEELGMTIGAVNHASTQKFINVTSRSFGVVSFDEKDYEAVSNLILKNTSLPTSITQRFGTNRPNQDTADIRVMENISDCPRVEIAESTEIGLAVLTLPKGLPARAPIEISFDLNEQGRLHVLAFEPTGKQKVETEIQTNSVISQEQLEEAIERSTKINIL
jgi:molecular chaperone DnaK